MFIKYITKRAIALSESRPPDFVIGDPNEPYMMRWWWLPRNKWFNIYIHRFLKDDDDRALHDHPWWSFSIMCQGYIREEYLRLNRTPGSTYTAYRDLLPGGWPLFRSSTFAHRIIVMKALDHKLPLTIFITGPKIREWGFHCKKAWRHWKDYVDTTVVGEIGRGCGEMDTDFIHCRKCGKLHEEVDWYLGLCPLCKWKEL